MKENIVKTKSYMFAIEIVGAYKYLLSEKKEYVLSKQLLRSGTSIGANIEEADGGQSKKDFYAKMAIAYKEAKETSYWLRLLKDTDYLTDEQFNSLSQHVTELLRLITAIQKSVKVGLISH